MHLKRVLALGREVSGAGDVHRHGASAHALGLDGEAHGAALLGVERDALGCVGEGERSVAADRDLVVATLAFDIIEVELIAPLSPISKKRGSVAVTTTGSRTITSSEA